MALSRRRRRRLRWLERLLFLAGIAGVGVWLWSVGSRAVSQDWENASFDRELRGEKLSIATYLGQKRARAVETVRGWLGVPNSPSAPNPVVAEEPVPSRTETPLNPPPAVPKDGVLGRLAIPRLHLSAMVREGTEDGTLRVAIGHISGTAFPGQVGNVGVAAHRDTIFRRLGEIRKNDEIEFETLAGKYTYRVQSTQIVKPQNVSVLKAHETPEITLVTCYPFYYVGAAPDRFIVRARQATEIRLGPQPTAVAQTAPPEVPRTVPPEVPRTVPEVTEDRRPAPHNVAFSLSTDHSRQLAPGISFGLTGTDPERHSVSGWMWLMPDRRTIWIRDQRAGTPVVFYGKEDGKPRELVITGVSRNGVTGYLVLPGENRARGAKRAVTTSRASRRDGWRFVRASR